MYSNILVPMALDHGLSPQTLGVAQALLTPGGRITALHVYEAPQGSVSAYLDEDAVRGAFDRARATLLAKLEGVAGVTPELIKGHTYRSIIDHAGATGVDCIVIGSHKPGLADYLLGSTAARVVRHAPCAVHVCRTR